MSSDSILQTLGAQETRALHHPAERRQQLVQSL